MAETSLLDSYEINKKYERLNKVYNRRRPLKAVNCVLYFVHNNKPSHICG